MMDNKTALENILKDYDTGIEGSKKAAEIAGKVAEGTAAYPEVYEAAREYGKVLNKSLADNLPAVLEDGQLALETAEAVVKPPMVRSAKDVSKVAKKVQEKMNDDAGLGIRFIEPDPNMDQIEGIITGLCEAESYEAGRKIFEDRVENYLEGHVDDCVHDNADFQYEAGLSPKIERQAVAGCCPWCSALAGVYEYSKVSNTGNDVFRRHRNCHCQVLYSPDGSRRRMQNAHTKKWTDGKNSATIEQRKKIGLQTSEDYHPERDRSTVKKALSDGTVKDSINKDLQARHLEGSDETRSYLYGGMEDAEKLYNKLKGTGTPVKDRKGNWQHKERVTNDKPVGILRADGKETETENAMIVYSKTGSHIYPRKGD